MCVWAGVLTYLSLFVSLPGASRCNRRAGPTCKYKVIMLHKTHSQTHTHIHKSKRWHDYFTVLSQGAPGPKGEPGEGLNEVKDISIFFLLGSFEKESKMNMMVLFRERPCSSSGKPWRSWPRGSWSWSTWSAFMVRRKTEMAQSILPGLRMIMFKENTDILGKYEPSLSGRELEDW